MAFPQLLKLPRSLVAIVYVVLYVLLDWASYVQPFGPFGITPWNPSAGLSLALILVFGERFLPLLFVAPLAAEIVVRHAPASPLVELALCAIIGLGYSAATLVLLMPRLEFQLTLPSMRDLLLLLGLAALAAAAVAVLVVVLLAAAGLIRWNEAVSAALRYWVGDVIGVVAVTPFLLILLTRGTRFRLGWEGVLQLAAIASALAILFAGPSGPQLQLFYVLFLPIIWIAVRHGLEGVTIGLVVTQLGLILAVYLSAARDIDVTAFQTLMLVLALAGLATGMLVTERRRAELQLRLQQEAQARIARLGSMGELAATIAHEINQPLMAAGTYSRLVVRNLQAGTGHPQLANDAAIKAANQIERAAEVVRRLRALIRLGRSEAAPMSLAGLTASAVELVTPELSRWRISIRQHIPDDLPPVLADGLQIEQVLINILRNAIEAIAGTAEARGTITVSAVRAADAFVEVAIVDTGPGLSPEEIESIATPFKTKKAEGLGVGLALSRSIVEAHGGRLWAKPSTGGASIHFTLPIAEAADR